MIYWKEKHAIIEDGVQRDAGNEDVSKLPLFVVPFNPQSEQSWAIEQLEATDLDILRWFESGVEPIGLKAYRDALRVYYKNLENNIESTRPVLDPRTTLKKVWDVVTFK